MTSATATPVQSVTTTAPASKAATRTGWVLTTLAVLFLLLDGTMKVLLHPKVLEASAAVEVPERLILPLGLILLAATLLYAAPPTAVLGAIVLTGYLGGAIWTHVRMGGPVFPMIFPAIVAAIVWGGLYLREPRLRELVPVRR